MSTQGIASAAAQRRATNADVALLVKIRDRAVELADSLGHSQYRQDAGGLFLDLLNVHEAVGLHLQELLAAGDGEFGHDVFGCYRHFDRETRTLQNGFCPRFARARATLDAVSQGGTGPSYTTQPAESLYGIALRQLGDESRWTEISALNADRFPDMREADRYPVGTVLRMPARSAAATTARAAKRI